MSTIDLEDPLSSDGSNTRSALLATSNMSKEQISKELIYLDNVINHKRLKWARQKQELEIKLQHKDQEVQEKQACIERMNEEISNLKRSLQRIEVNTSELMKKYEREIEHLHSQLEKFKQRKFKKAAATVAEKITHKSGTVVGDPSIKPSAFACNAVSSSTINSSGEAPVIRPSTQQHPTDLPSSSSSPKIRTTRAYSMNNLHRPENDKKLNTRLFKEPEMYEAEIQRLREQLNEHKEKESEMFRERDELNQLIEYQNRQNNELKRKVEELKRTDRIPAQRDSPNMFHFNEPGQSTDSVRQEIKKKDHQIKTLEGLLDNAKIEVTYYKDEIKNHKKRELDLMCEIGEARKEREEVNKRVILAEEENKKIKHKVESLELKSKNDEQILKKKFTKEIDSQARQIANMSMTIHNLRQDLQHKEEQVKSIIHDHAELEKKLHAKEIQLKQLSQDLNVNMAHNEALKLENEFLKKKMSEKASGEKEVNDIKAKYDQMLKMREDENKELRSRINQLTEKIDQIKSNKSSNPIYPNELIQRNVKRVQEECEARLEAANRQHEATIKRMNDQIEKLHAEKDAITRALHHTPNRDTAHLGRPMVHGALSSGSSTRSRDYLARNNNDTLSEREQPINHRLLSPASVSHAGGLLEHTKVNNLSEMRHNEVDVNNNHIIHNESSKLTVPHIRLIDSSDSSTKSTPNRQLLNRPSLNDQLEARINDLLARK